MERKIQTSQTYVTTSSSLLFIWGDQLHFGTVNGENSEDVAEGTCSPAGNDGGLVKLQRAIPGLEGSSLGKAGFHFSIP